MGVMLSEAAPSPVKCEGDTALLKTDDGALAAAIMPRGDKKGTYVKEEEEEPVDPVLSLEAKKEAEVEKLVPSVGEREQTISEETEKKESTGGAEAVSNQTVRPYINTGQNKKGKVGPFKCEHCNVRFKEARVLRRHLVRQHGEPKRRKGKPPIYTTEEEKRAAAILRMREYRKRRKLKKKAEAAAQVLWSFKKDGDFCEKVNGADGDDGEVSSEGTR